MSAPTTTLIRRGEALRWLREHGVSEYIFDLVCATRAEAGKPLPVPIGKRAYYRTTEIAEVFLNQPAANVYGSAGASPSQ